MDRCAEVDEHLIPVRLRYGLPLLVTANIGLLLCGHLCVATVIRLEGYAPFDKIKPKDVSKDNLISAAGNLAEADAWLAVFAVVVMSGVWPYTKLFAAQSMVCLVDYGKITRDQGYQVLVVLEKFGKWSFADIMLLCLNILIFDISTDRYRVGALFHLKIDIFMQMQFGAVALIIALIFSALLTSWAKEELSPPSCLLGDDDLVDEELSRPTKLRDSSDVYLILAAAFISFVIGANIPFAHIDRNGFLGNLIRERRNLDLSLFSVASSLREVAELRQQPMLNSLAVVFLTMVCVIPLLELMFLTLSVLSVASHAALSSWSWRIAEGLRSFNCIDVLLTVVIIIVMQLKTIVQFNLVDECEDMKGFISGGPGLTIAGLGMAASKDCLRLEPLVLSGWWFLLFSILFRMKAWKRCQELHNRHSVAIVYGAKSK